MALLAVGVNAQSPFATRVLEYDPSPGQFVNNSTFNDPGEALGPPEGHGLEAGNNLTVVTLGGFGGRLVLGFDHTIEDHPLNPLGLDFIVFANAFFPIGDVNVHWAESGVVEIAIDVNANGVADDPWFLIPGSHLTPVNPTRFVQVWDDNPFSSTPPALLGWIPPGHFGRWESEGLLLPPEIFARSTIVNPDAPPGFESVFGYADFSPVKLLGDWDGDNVVEDSTAGADEFYTWPDDPFTVGIDPGSGGGDAFDIAWAVDPAKGTPAGLWGFDFIRISSATSAVLGPLGEVSPEIDAVADVPIDPFGDFDADEDIDLEDAADYCVCTSGTEPDGIDCESILSIGRRSWLENWRRMAPRVTGPR